jgi:hypothetical protein
MWADVFAGNPNDIWAIFYRIHLERRKSEKNQRGENEMESRCHREVLASGDQGSGLMSSGRGWAEGSF